MTARGLAERIPPFALRVFRHVSGRVSGHPTAATPVGKPPSLAQFVALSLLLHVLVLVMLRESEWVGADFPAGAWMTRLNVALRPLAAERVAAIEPSSTVSGRPAPVPSAARTVDAASAPPRPRVEARPAERAAANAGELPTVAAPGPAKPANTPAQFVAPAESLAAPAIPLGHLEAAPKVDRDFAPLAKLAPPRELPPANAPALQHLDRPPQVDHAFAPIVKLVPPKELPPVDAPLRRLDPPPKIERALAPVPKVERPRELAADASPLQHLDAAPAIDRALPPVPKPETPRELAARTSLRPLQPLDPVPTIDKALTPLPKPETPSELATADAPLPRLDAPALDRTFATLPKTEIPRELAAATQPPLSRLEAPPTVDRELAALPKAAPSGELAAATVAPLGRLAAPPGIDRVFTPPAPLGPPPDLPAAGAAPLARLEGAPTVDRSFAPQAGLSDLRGDSRGPASSGDMSRAVPGIDRPFAPRQETTPPRDATPADGAPRLDIDATRRLAREINRAPVPSSRGRAMILTPPPPETESRLGRAIAKAAQPDCRDAYARLGLLALPILIFEAATDTGCRW